MTSAVMIMWLTLHLISIVFNILKELLHETVFVYFQMPQAMSSEMIPCLLKFIKCD